MDSEIQTPVAPTNSTITNLKVSPAAPNILHVPSEMHAYINEKGEGRSFNIESVNIRHVSEPNHVVVDLSIVNKGAELLEPFMINLVLGDVAAQQFAQAISRALSKDGKPEG